MTGLDLKDTATSALLLMSDVQLPSDRSDEELPSDYSEDDDLWDPAPAVAIGEQSEDVAEVFSSPRVVPHCAQIGMTALRSFDLKLGNNFLEATERAALLHYLGDKNVKVVVLSPPCTMFSALQVMWNKQKMQKAGMWQPRMDMALTL